MPNGARALCDVDRAISLMATLDPRINPFRPELAAKHLQGKVKAELFVEGEARQVLDAQAPLRHAPTPDARLDSEALMGERVTIYDSNDEGWCWGQLETDGYVGWIASNALGPLGIAPTHKVSVLRTLGFPGPDIKLPPAAALPMGARLAIVSQDERFAVSATGLYLPLLHLSPLNAKATDFVAVAERFLGTPYLWGGKTNLGIDCSGLVQVSLQAVGIACPRDADLQEITLGKISTQSNLRRGDLVFWKGHVAIVSDQTKLLHANGFHMSVVYEPLADAIARIRAVGNEITSIKRL